MAKRNSTRNSSMPTNPILKGRRWTTALRNRVVGRWVLIGWSDSPAEAGIAIEDGTSDPLFWSPTIGLMHIDHPGQVIDISFPIRDSNPYLVTKSGWSVVG